FFILVIASTIISEAVREQLVTIRLRIVPKVDLEVRLTHQLENLTRGFQDAVAARDADDLAATRAIEDTLISSIGLAAGSVDAAQVDALKNAVDDYYATAFEVSRRLVAGETGEAILEAMTGMQKKQRQLAELLTRTTRLERAEVDRAFSIAEHRQLVG